MNKHKLSRFIPRDIKLKIRQNSKFGCVVPNCRNAFYTYEHLIPEFKDAKFHDPENICLACSNHNPRRTGKDGQENYSKAQLIEFYNKIKENELVPEVRNNDFFNGFNVEPEIKIGNSLFVRIASIINIDGVNVFSFQKNLEEDIFAPQFTFSGTFYNSRGDLLFRIEENEWFSPSNHWDIQTTNGEIKIWDNSKNLVFGAKKIPQSNTIEITTLDLWFKPFHLIIEDGNLLVGRYSEDMESWIYFSVDGSFKYGDCGIYLNSSELFKTPISAGWSITGGKGATINGNGIWLGRGAGQMLIKNINYIKSENIIEAKILTIQKKLKPPPGAHYFVKGILTEKISDFPMWKEKVFYLNGQQLENKPNSWGKIDNDTNEHLYYISYNEPCDLSLNKGFIGFYANDVLKEPWSDKVFEAEVIDIDDEGREITVRVKRADIGDRKIVSELNPNNNKYWHPHQFSGNSPWKNG